jgi:hypothetical protein
MSIAEEPLLAEAAAGPPGPGDLPLLQTTGALIMGMVGLLLSGPMPLLLGALAGEGHIPVERIGDTAMAEALAMAAANAAFSAFVPPARIRLIAAAAVLTLAAIDLATGWAHGWAVVGVRALAGVPEGVLLWILISMVVRSKTPERWSGVYYTGLTLSELGLTAALTGLVLPRFHAIGAFIVAAGLIALCAPLALLCPREYAALPSGATRAGSPPARGWLALSVTFLFTASIAGVAIYFVPLAKQAGLSAGIAGAAITASLGVQIVGSGMATALAGRIRYYVVLLASGGVVLASWAAFAAMPPAWLFIAGAMAIGFVALFSAPFQVPMLIEADPSRSAAAQSGGVGLLGGAIGPFLASRVIAGHGAQAVLALGAAMLITALLILSTLHLTRVRPAAAMTA